MRQAFLDDGEDLVDQIGRIPLAHLLFHTLLNLADEVVFNHESHDIEK